MLWTCTKNSFYTDIIDQEYIITIIKSKNHKIRYQNKKSLDFYKHCQNILNFISNHIQNKHDLLDFMFLLNNKINQTIHFQAKFDGNAYNTSIDNLLSIKYIDKCIYHKIVMKRVNKLIYFYQDDITNQINKTKVVSQQLDIIKELYPVHIIQGFVNNVNNVFSIKEHDNVAILFLDISDFTKLCKMYKPKQCIQMLDKYFSALDKLCVIYNLQKVDTCGDCYIVAGGLFNIDINGFKIVQTFHNNYNFCTDTVKFAMDAISITSEFPVKIGIHIGKCVSGIIGNKLPKFTIIGDSVNVAARIQQNANSNSIIVSDDFYSKVVDKFNWISLGNFDMKGVGSKVLYKLDNLQAYDEDLIEGIVNSDNINIFCND